jgi:hypothetical protein
MGIDPKTFSSLPLRKKQGILREIVDGVIHVTRADMHTMKQLLPWTDSRIRSIDIEMVFDNIIEAGEALLALRDLCNHYNVKMDWSMNGCIEAVCKACGYKWQPRKPLELVKECPACKTRDWK